MRKIAKGIYEIIIGTPEEHTPIKLLKPQHRYTELNKLSDIPCPFALSDIGVRITKQSLTLEIPLSSEEDVYGLGLQLKSFCQSGKKKLLRPNSDPASDTGDSHAPVPFYVSSNGYGVLIDTARYISFHCGNLKKVGGPSDIPGKESAGTDVGFWEVKSGTGNMFVSIPAASGVSVYIFCGENMLDAVCRYNLFSGGGVVPPLWGLGILYRGDMTAGQEALLSLAKEIRDDRVPCDIFGLEPGWQSHAYSSSYVWDKTRFPDPDGFLAELKAMGYKPNLWEQPYVHPSSPIFSEMKPHAGNYYVWDGLIPDFADEKASTIFAGQQQTLVDQGVDGFKLDECDNSDFTSNWGFPDFTAFPSGIDGMQMHSVIGQLYQRAMLRPFQLKGRRTYGQVRCSGALAAPFPYVLYSDLYDHTDFVRGMASAAFSGLLWSPEVRQTATEEELIRRLQAVIISPQAVINCFLTPSPPWKQYDYEKNRAGELLADADRLTADVRELFNLRMRLIPHLYAAFYRYYEQGIPPVRPLIMEYPKDKNCRDLYREFMIGDGLLAAPVIYGAGRQDIYLPDGIWYDFYTGEQIRGGKFVVWEKKQLPLFVREGTLMALAVPNLYVDQTTVFGLEFQAYGRGEAFCELFEDDGVSNEYLHGKYKKYKLKLDRDNQLIGLDGAWRYQAESVRRIGF